MTLLEILQQKEDRLQDVPDALSNKTIAAQRKILKELIRQLESLDRKDGKIIISTQNLAQIQQIADNLSTFIFDETDYPAALRAFAGEFNSQAALSRKFIKQINSDFEDKQIYQANLRLSQRQTIELLSKSAVSQVFINPMKDILQASITVGSSIPEATAVLSDLVIGNNEKEGALLSHVKQVAYDGFAFSDRQYLKLVVDDLKYEYFQYFGGRLRDSRCFCVDRLNQIFHRKEIEHWGETPSLWDKQPGCHHGGGRILQTNASTIWTYAGGYNCRHQIVPVAPSQVPKQVVARAMKAGFIK